MLSSLLLFISHFIHDHVMLPSSSLLRTYLLRINQKNEDNSKVAPLSAFPRVRCVWVFPSYHIINYMDPFLESPDN